MLLRESLIFTVVYLRLVSARLEYLDLKPRCYFETISCPCERYGTPEKSVNVTLKVCNRLNLNEHKKSVCSGKAIVEKCRGAYLIQGRERRNADSQSFHCVNGTVKFLTSPSPPNAHVGPPQVTINGRLRNLKEGGHAEFKCTFVSTLPFTVTWLFNGRPLRNDSRYSYFDCKAGLQFKLLMSTDQGNYTCVATNALGQSSNASSRLSFIILPFHPTDELKTVPPDRGDELEKVPPDRGDELEKVPPDRGDELEKGGLPMAFIPLIALVTTSVIVLAIVTCCVAKQNRRLRSTTRKNRRTKGKTEEDNEKLLGATTGDRVSCRINASAVKNGSETDVVYTAKQREKHLQEWEDHDHEGNLKEKSTERSLGNEASEETGSFPLCFPKEVTPKPQDSPRAALKSEGAIFIANPLELPIIQGTKDNEKLLGATTGDRVSCRINASAVKNGSETDVVYTAKQREKHLQEWEDHDHEGNLKEKSTERSPGNEASVETGSFPLCFPKEVTPSKPQDSPRAALKSEGEILIANPLELPITQGTKGKNINQN